MNNFQDIANFLWSIADEVLRDDFKRGKYPDVILPFTVLRRVDCVLAPTKQKVLEKHDELQRRGLKNMDGQLCMASGYSFYNISQYDFPKLLDDPKNIGKNLRNYINGFSANMREVIEKFKLRSTIDTLEEKGLLFLLIQKFCSKEVDLHPDNVDNHAMGTVFEELIRRFNEQTNENPGEHFTPREVILLMVRLLINGDTDMLKQGRITRTVYDPACGTGGMLTIAKEYIRDHINPHADIRLFGQEVNDETFAVCKSDMLIKGDDHDANNIKCGSSFSQDGHPFATFEYMLSNPPYGKDWSKEKDFISDEESKGSSGRFEAGTPSKDDGQMLFLQHMLSKRKPSAEGGSRIAIVHNASPLFNGEVTTGSECRNENNIRRWIIENDWLEAIVALPSELFYNTGINTYIWVLTNRKPEERKGKVLLVNGAAKRKENGDEGHVFANKMRKSLGQKRNEMGEEHIDRLARLVTKFEESEHSKLFDIDDFGYRRIRVERPLRLNFQVSPERIDRLKEHPTFKKLAMFTTLRQRGRIDGNEIDAGLEEQKQTLKVLNEIDGSVLYKNREEFQEVLDSAFGVGRKLSAPMRKAILLSLSERDETADICMDADGRPEPDPELRDYENVPLKESIYDYFEREVKPYVPDAWIDESLRDEKDGQVGKVGYEISFTRYFYQYEPPRPLEEIERDLSLLEVEIQQMLTEVIE